MLLCEHGEHQASFTFLNQNWALVSRESFLEIEYISDKTKKKIFLIQEEMDKEIEKIVGSRDLFSVLLYREFLHTHAHTYMACLHSDSKGGKKILCL